MKSLESSVAEQRTAAEARIKERASQRQQNVVALASPGGLAAANPEERIARRVDRVTRYFRGEQTPMTAAQVPTAASALVLAASRERAPVFGAQPGASDEVEGISLEKIINTRDLLAIRYLEAGVAAARAVCRVLIRDDAGRLMGYGTGSLVTRRLALTNHHVLPTKDVARVSAIEFNYQDGLDAQPLQARVFPLDPDAFFLSDTERDFALVAVNASEEAIAQFGFNPLIEAQGKALVGEFVTIVQHPGGEKKQVALRENRIVDLLDEFLHYEADTEPGSSGSPVFNDQWEIVALHHASVPDDGGGFVNEGVRASRILNFVREQPATPGEGALLAQLFDAEGAIGSRGVEEGNRAPSSRSDVANGPSEPREAEAVAGLVRINVPLEVTLRLGVEAKVADSDLRTATAYRREARLNADLERVNIDPDYTNRGGYDRNFLGKDLPAVSLPGLPGELLAKTPERLDAPQGDSHVLPYHHFSVIMNKERRLAFVTAVNIDGTLSRRLKRESDQWFLDPRIAVEGQTGEGVYVSNDLDRGHLVRRLDPAWGESREVAKVANDDTFHFTNCTPQHKEFNQNQTTWAGLEDYILENADNRDLRVSVFTGPVFADDDEDYRGVKLPRQFWKVVVMAKANGSLSATGYLLSQEALLRGLEAEFLYGAYRTYQLPIERIEGLTGLSFNSLKQADPLGRIEAIQVQPKEIKAASDLTL